MHTSQSTRRTHLKVFRTCLSLVSFHFLPFFKEGLTALKDVLPHPCLAGGGVSGHKRETEIIMQQHNECVRVIMRTHYDNSY